MKKKLLRPQQLLLILTLLLLIASMLPSKWAMSLSRQPRHFINAAIRPVTHPLKMVSDHLRRPTDLQAIGVQQTLLRQQYEVALQTIRQLEWQLDEARQEIAALSQAREYLGLRGVQLYPASVVAWSGGASQPSLTINRGSNHGLRVGLVAASGFNLVGRLSSVGPVTSTVRLVTSPETQLTVKIVPPSPDSPARQLLVQAISTGQDNLFMAQTDVTDPVEVGDLAHLADDNWPGEAAGLVLGKVVKVESDPDDPILRRLTYIQPIRSFAYLSRVVIEVPADGQALPGQDPAIVLEEIREDG